MKEIENIVARDPHLLERLPPLPVPPPTLAPENPGHVAIRRLNWERRVKRLKRDWYGKYAA